MPRLKLETVDGRRGAPHGRREWHPLFSNGDGLLQLAYVRFPWRDAYDYGGAYWGLPANLWHAEGWMEGPPEKYWLVEPMDEEGHCHVRFFVRADNREAAKKAVKERFPNVRFYR